MRHLSYSAECRKNMYNQVTMILPLIGWECAMLPFLVITKLCKVKKGKRERSMRNVGYWPGKSVNFTKRMGSNGFQVEFPNFCYPDGLPLRFGGSSGLEQPSQLHSNNPFAGLSLSFEAGVTLNISHVTCKYMGSLRKFFKLVPRKCIYQPSEVQSIKNWWK